MEWLQENWFWLLVGVLFVWMHMGHGHHGEEEPDSRSGSTEYTLDDARRRHESH